MHAQAVDIFVCCNCARGLFIGIVFNEKACFLVGLYEIDVSVMKFKFCIPRDDYLFRLKFQNVVIIVH